MSNPQTALIVGDYTDGDPIVEVFQNAARQLGYTLAAADYKTACEMLLGAREQHLVLFCVPFGMGRPREILKSLYPCARRTIAYVHTAMASTDEAIRYSHDGLADGYVVGGDGAFDEECARSFDSLVRQLHRNDLPYEPISLHWNNNGDRIAVVSTAFDLSHRLEMTNAVAPALERFGFRVEWADADYRQGGHEAINRIRENIKRCSLLLARVTVDPRFVKHNDNVYFEAGIAASEDPQKVFFVWRNGEPRIDLPVSIGNERILTYRDEIHFAQLLYHGLRQHVH